MALTVQELRSRLAGLPRVSLAHTPTPVSRTELRQPDGGSVTLLIKRDDCTGLAFGGNKVRHLEFILADAVKTGADCVVQGAAAQSNFARQLTAAANQLGIDTYLCPRQDEYAEPLRGNLFVATLLGAEVRPVPHGAGSLHDAKEAWAAELRKQGRKPYVVGMGAWRSLALAGLGYVEAFVEIVEWCARQQIDPPESLYLASQGSTQAGLQVAAQLLDVPTRVVGINPMDERQEAFLTRDEIARLMNEIYGLLGLRGETSAENVENRTDQVGDGYGKVTIEGRQAQQYLATNEGIILDPVYTAKAFAGLMADYRQGRLSGHRSVMFVHTGGTPAIFAYGPDALL